MIKAVLLVLAASLSSLASAGTMEILKSTPASKYDVGKLQLEFLTFILTEKLQDEWVKGSEFNIKKFSLKESGENLSFVMSFVGKAKYMTDEQCSGFKAAYSEKFLPMITSEDLWPGLTAEQYEALNDEVIFNVELISKENESFKIHC